MKYLTLDAQVSEELERCLEQRKATQDRYGYFTRLFGFGFDAVVTTVFMREAHKLQRPGLLKFLEKYDVIMDGTNYGDLELEEGRILRIVTEKQGLVLDRTAIAQDNIYVPQYHRKELLLFDTDQGNAFYDTGRGSHNSPFEIARMNTFERIHWFPELLLSRDLTKRGMAYGQALWDGVIARMDMASFGQQEPVAKALVTYYSSIVHR